MVPLLQSADDSNGVIGGVIDESILALQDLARANMPHDTSKYIFKKILKESTSKIYDGWDDWRLSLVETCAQLVVNTERRKIFEKHLGKLTRPKLEGFHKEQSRKGNPFKEGPTRTKDVTCSGYLRAKSIATLPPKDDPIMDIFFNSNASINSFKSSKYEKADSGISDFTYPL